MIDDILAFLALTPFDEMLEMSLLGKGTKMPVWVLILLAIIFGWLVMPKIVAYVGK